MHECNSSRIYQIDQHFLIPGSCSKEHRQKWMEASMISIANVLKSFTGKFFSLQAARPFLLWILVNHLRVEARARVLPSPLLGTVLPAVLGLLNQAPVSLLNHKDPSLISISPPKITCLTSGILSCFIDFVWFCHKFLKNVVTLLSQFLSTCVSDSGIDVMSQNSS